MRRWLWPSACLRARWGPGWPGPAGRYARRSAAQTQRMNDRTEPMDEMTILEDFRSAVAPPDPGKLAEARARVAAAAHPGTAHPGTAHPGTAARPSPPPPGPQRRERGGSGGGPAGRAC